MTDQTAQARELFERIKKAYFLHASEEAFVTLLAAALSAVEQRVWEEAAVYLDTEAKRFDHVDDGEAHMIRAFAAWCRAQAKEAAQEREKDES